LRPLTRLARPLAFTEETPPEAMERPEAAAAPPLEGKPRVGAPLLGLSWMESGQEV